MMVRSSSTERRISQHHFRHRMVTNDTDTVYLDPMAGTVFNPYPANLFHKDELLVVASFQSQSQTDHFVIAIVVREVGLLKHVVM